MPASTWLDFFDAYQAFESKITAQRARGLNNFNILTAVLSIHDEVRLHSRFIGSLLDPKGTHGQGPLFLEAFLKAVFWVGTKPADPAHAGSIDVWPFDVENARVYIEHRHIDIYVTDRTRHIVIENKVNAADPSRQVERYIDAVRSPAGREDIGEGEVGPEDLLFIYLSKSRDAPPSHSLGAYELDRHRGYLVSRVSGSPVARYKNVHYRTHILRWLDICQEEAGNLTNINYALAEYRQVVERLNGTYKNKLMDLNSFFAEAPQGGLSDRVRIALEIEEQLPTIKARWLSHIMNEGADAFLNAQGCGDQLERVQQRHVEGELADRLFKGADATTFFEGSSAGKNKAVLWRFLSGPNRNSHALILAYGATWLHAGVVPIEQVNEDQSLRQGIDDASLGTHTISLDKGSEELKKQKIGKKFPGIRSWGGSLDSAMRGMIDEKSFADKGLPISFAQSRHAKVLAAAAKHFLR